MFIQIRPGTIPFLGENALGWRYRESDVRKIVYDNNKFGKILGRILERLYFNVLEIRSVSSRLELTVG